MMLAQSGKSAPGGKEATMDDQTPAEPWLDLSVPEPEPAPPVRHAVPAETLPPLEAGQLVTFGLPGGWWIIDQAQVVSGPHRSGDEETYSVMPFTEWAAVPMRDEDRDVAPHEWRCRVSYRRTADLWIYREHPGPATSAEDVPPFDSNAWLRRVEDEDPTPPPVLRARPARELPSLIGRQLWAAGLRNRDTWHQAIAVSEPLALGDKIMVKIVPVRTYYELMAGRAAPADQPYVASLHRLWTY